MAGAVRDHRGTGKTGMPCRTACVPRVSYTHVLTAAQLAALCQEGHPRSPTWRVSTAEHCPKSGVTSSHIGTKTSCSKKPSFMVSINLLSKSCPDAHFRAQSPCLFILACKVSALLQYSLPNTSCQNTLKKPIILINYYYCMSRFYYFPNLSNSWNPLLTEEGTEWVGVLPPGQLSALGCAMHWLTQPLQRAGLTVADKPPPQTFPWHKYLGLALSGYKKPGEGREKKASSPAYLQAR